MFCMKCGATLEDGTKFCSVCGEPVNAEPVDAQAVSEEPQVAPAPEVFVTPTPEVVVAPAPKAAAKPAVPAENSPLSPWSYFGLQLLFSVPLVGFIFLIIFSINRSNINRRNFARSYWCGLIIVLIVFATVLIIGLVLALLGMGGSAIGGVDAIFGGAGNAAIESGMSAMMP